MPIKFENPKAFCAMSQEVVWREDAPPHRRGTFRAAVLQGESESSSAGPSLDGVVADPWTVFIPLGFALAGNIKIGDTLTILTGVCLTVQQITRTDHEYLARCTSEMRAPNG